MKRVRQDVPCAGLIKVVEAGLGHHDRPFGMPLSNGSQGVEQAMDVGIFCTHGNEKNMGLLFCLGYRGHRLGFIVSSLRANTRRVEKLEQGPHRIRRPGVQTRLASGALEPKTNAVFAQSR